VKYVKFEGDYLISDTSASRMKIWNKDTNQMVITEKSSFYTLIFSAPFSIRLLIMHFFIVANSRTDDSFRTTVSQDKYKVF
jgi:hypothetical protein